MNKALCFWTHIALIFLVSAPLLLKAQSPVFAPLGAVWRYNAYDPGLHYGQKQYRYVVTKDTILDGWNARLVQGEIWENGAFIPSPVMTRYVSTVGDKVYHRVDTSFVLLYDFGAQPGDTIFSAVDGYFPFFNFCAYPPGVPTDFAYIIDSLGSMEINGMTLRTQYVQRIESPLVSWNILGVFTGSPGVPVIERIGGIAAGTWYGGNTTCIQEGGEPTLRCYTDNDIYFEGNTLGIPCDSVLATATPEKPVFNVGPNPFTDEIRIQIPPSSHSPLQFTLFDLAGQVIIEKSVQEGENSMPVPGAVAGFYFWELRRGGVLVGSGKLVK